MKTYLIILLAATTMVSKAQLGAKVQQSVAGTWQNSDMGFMMILLLNADGSGEFDGEMIRYTVQNNQMTVVQQGISSTYAFTLQGNKLTLSGGDLDSPLSFTRVGAGSEPSSNAAAAMGTTQASGGDASALLGPWSANGDVIDFKPNGQCIYMGQNYGYQASANTVTLITQQGNLVMNYNISGDKLNLMANGKTVVFTRGNNPRPSTNSTGSGGIAQELVGRWCFVDVTRTNSGGATTEECIELRADGSYTYNSERSMDTNTSAYWAGTNATNNDQGTWTYDGNRIYYNSASRGQGSYQLVKQNHPRNGDPMIVLDGKAYVTYYQKSPW